MYKYKLSETLPLDYCKITVELECGSILVGCSLSYSETVDGHTYKYIYWNDLEIDISKIKYWKYYK